MQKQKQKELSHTPLKIFIFLTIICPTLSAMATTTAPTNELPLTENQIIIPTPTDHTIFTLQDELTPLTTKEKITAIADRLNFKYTNYLLRLAVCESHFNPTARNNNGKLGMDRGVFQINSYFHPTVTDEQADDITFATEWTINQINNGNQHLWICDSLIKANPDKYNYKLSLIK